MGPKSVDGSCPVRMGFPYSRTDPNTEMSPSINTKAANAIKIGPAQIDWYILIQLHPENTKWKRQYFSYKDTKQIQPDWPIFLRLLWHWVYHGWLLEDCGWWWVDGGGPVVWQCPWFYVHNKRHIHTQLTQRLGCSMLQSPSYPDTRSRPSGWCPFQILPRPVVLPR